MATVKASAGLIIRLYNIYIELLDLFYLYTLILFYF